jgi:hypothetical protein
MSDGLWELFRLVIPATPVRPQRPGMSCATGQPVSARRIGSRVLLMLAERRLAGAWAARMSNRSEGVGQLCRTPRRRTKLHVREGVPGHSGSQVHDAERDVSRVRARSAVSGRVIGQWSRPAAHRRVGLGVHGQPTAIGTEIIAVLDLGPGPTEVELVESWGLTARRSCGITGACGIHKGAGWPPNGSSSARSYDLRRPSGSPEVRRAR